MKRSIVVACLITILIVLLFAVSAVAESGNYDGIDWDLTDGVLTLGRENETQTLRFVENRYSYSWPWANLASDIIDVQCPGSLILNGSLREMFSGCPKVTSIDTSRWDVSGVTSLRSTFSGCSLLESLDVGGWDVSSVWDMGQCFYNCKALTELDVSRWNTSNVSNMGGLFERCSGLLALDVRFLSMTRVNDLSHMFDECSSLTSLDLSRWQLDSATSMMYLFYKCTNLTDLNCSNWNMPNMKNMGYVFNECRGLTTLDLSTWTLPVVECSMSSLFGNCMSLSSLNMSGWNTEWITSIEYMFNGCSGLTSLDLSGWNTSRVKYVAHMFHNCNYLTDLNLSGWNLSGIASMDSMFCNCTGLKTLNISGWNTPNLENMYNSFYNCSSLVSIDVSDLDTDNVISVQQAFGFCSELKSIDLSSWNVEKVQNMNGLFMNCSNMETIDLDGWITSSATNMESMFKECQSLTSVDVSNFDTSHVTNMGQMFYRCYKLQTIDVSDWDTSSVTDMYSVFLQCRSAQHIDVSNWDMSNVYDISQMFYECTGLLDLDVSKWNTEKIKYMRYSFQGCALLTELDVSGWDTSSVLVMPRLFMSCGKLKSLDMGGWDTSHVTEMTAIFDFCYALKEIDVTGWDTSHVTDFGNRWFINCYLEKIITGENYPFSTITINVPPNRQDGVDYTRKWIREDKTAGPYTVEELRDNYISSMAGTWVWEKVPTEYNITFACTEDGYVGEMPPVTVVAAEDYELPGNAFFVFGEDFDHWTDGTRRIYSNREVIPANTYAVDAEVTLTAVFEPRDRNVDMQDGSFDFSIKGNEKAFFSPIPASTSYQVYEQTPFGWNLIKQAGNTGVIESNVESEALFLNKYDPLKATVRFVGTKLMDGRVAEAETFSFVLYEDDTLLDVATVEDAGVIEFQSITYDQAGVHNYTIQEVIGNNNSVEYDTHVESIVVTVESDGVGHLSVDIQMDEDKIVFNNKSKPGMLALRKAGVNNADESREDIFTYEVQFITQNGQPYELAESEISYEEREGDIGEFPEVQPLPEKPKYRLNLQYLVKDDGVTPIQHSYDIEYHEAGEIVSISPRTIDSVNRLTKYVLESVDSGFIQLADGTWKGIMPQHELTVKLVYGKYADYTLYTSWGGDATVTEKPILSAILYANGEQYRVAESICTGNSYVFENCPVFDINGNVIEYTVFLPDIDGYHIYRHSYDRYQARYGVNYGFNGYVIWDDMDDYYGLRPSSLSVKFTQWVSSSNMSVNAKDRWRYGKTYQYDSTTHPVSISVENRPSGYTVITHDQDNTIGQYDLKLKLTSLPIEGNIVWTGNWRPSETQSIELYNDKGSLVSRKSLDTDAADYSFGYRDIYYADGTDIVYSVKLVFNDATDRSEFERLGCTITYDGYDITVNTPSTAEITITDVTLLSSEEYSTYKSSIPSKSAGWWLRSPGSVQYCASVVNPFGSISAYYVNDRGGYVRPALICDLGSFNLSVGDKILLADYNWTVISTSVNIADDPYNGKAIILCDDFVGKTEFRWDSTVADADVYSASDVKVWLENWATENGIMPEQQFEITEVTLLSENEYNTYRDEIAFDMAQWWWLRSPGAGSMYANFVRSDTGSVGNYAHSVSTNYFGVRPALICNLNDVGYSVGDKVSGSGYEWTVISNSINVADDPYNGYGLILCDEIVGQTAFRADSSASDANVYDASDVKQWLADWVATHPFWTKTVIVEVIQ